MSDLVPVDREPSLPAPRAYALGEATPTIEELFRFAREAELRVGSLRMSIAERSWTTKGEDVVVHDVLLRHPRRARITTRHDEDPISDDYEVWIGDGDQVRTYDARGKRASIRSMRAPVVGPAREDLPPYARTYEPLTPLPAGTMADAFIHPHGLFRNVLVTGPLAIVGTLDVHGREAIVVRTEHPRSTKVLTDRPDRSVEVGIDRATGFLIHLSERIGERLTHLAEVTALEPDADIPDSAFVLHLGADVRMIY